MMARRVFAVIYLCMVVIPALLSISSTAVEIKVVNRYQGMVTLANNSYDAYIITLNDKEDTLSVMMYVTGGLKVDTFLVIESEYTKYKSRASSFMYITPFSSVNTDSNMFTMRAEESPYGTGTYVFIVDNQNYTSPGASPKGSVRYTINISVTSPAMFNTMIRLLLIGGVIAMIVILIIVGIIMIREKRHARTAKGEVKTPPKVIIFCPTCALPATWIPKYQRYYCKAEKKYLPKGIPPPP